MTQYFLTLPHDSAEEPTMESMDPAALQEVFGRGRRVQHQAQGRRGLGVRRRPAPALVRHHGRRHRRHADPHRRPYVEAKEYLGGFWIIEAPDLDAAIEYAKLGSKALGGRIEVRPFQEVPQQDES